MTQRRAGGPSAQRFLEIRFKQVRIVDVSVAMSDENLIPLETVSFAFESVTLDYTPQAATRRRAKRAPQLQLDCGHGAMMPIARLEEPACPCARRPAEGGERWSRLRDMLAGALAR